MKLCNESTSNSGLFETILDEKMRELEDYRETIMRGHQVRARARWIEGGEKSSKYFSNLEKRNYINKNVTKLETENNCTVTDQKSLLLEISNFYERLYSYKHVNDIGFSAILPSSYDIPKLNENESKQLDGDFQFPRPSK